MDDASRLQIMRYANTVGVSSPGDPLKEGSLPLILDRIVMRFPTLGLRLLTDLRVQLSKNAPLTIRESETYQTHATKVTLGQGRKSIHYGVSRNVTGRLK
jgi:hypothetical protein